MPTFAAVQHPISNESAILPFVALAEVALVIMISDAPSDSLDMHSEPCYWTIQPAPPRTAIGEPVLG